ncbi:glycoside hydrolase 5 family protein [Sphingomonas psychrotolerans]|uniref:mannan endo-1,4-beta-mannosidase n=1 Tax=Sphingomonas psychrotolerans TaxID=1327635 RepID=A0A2K8MCT5_9SPHN|nr:cellulase family glycosylhydrolase [Sphingomonas psychrotolerans]ATY31708.1 mannanase [Sphingomonas psychrotolerans]
MVTRRSLIGTSAAVAATLALPLHAAAAPAFVRREGTRLLLGGRPYRFAGANLWHAAWLGATAPFGDRARLTRELDMLAATGVTNLRILASAEDSPLKNSVKPAFHGAALDSADPALLDGLDFCLAEMRKRGMKAVIYLTNFWEWSGGMMTYLYYVTGKYMDVNDPAHPWPAFPNATAQFYANPKAVALNHAWVRRIVGRTNAITGTAYRDDPTIMAWQLANEPRPAGEIATATPLLPAYYAWIQGTAKLIKSLDSNHLVSTGSEGLKGSVESADIYRTAHAFAEIDYLTAHIWPLNWSWVDAKDIVGTHAAATAKVAEYLQQHQALAKEIGKPLVIEEFGYPRDGGGYDPQGSTRFKDLYYQQIYDAVLTSARTGGPVVGSNFWAWNGEGRAVHGDHRFKPGDTAWLGDPPHEPQGWYGVFDSDASTRAVIKAHADALATVGEAIAT